MSDKRVEELLNEIVDDLGIWAADVMRPDSEFELLRVSENVNLPIELQEIPYKIDSSTLNGRAFLTGEAQFVEDINMQQFMGIDFRHTITNAVAVPLEVNEEVFATLELLSDTKTVFTHSMLTHIHPQIHELIDIVSGRE